MIFLPAVRGGRFGRATRYKPTIFRVTIFFLNPAAKMTSTKIDQVMLILVKFQKCLCAVPTAGACRCHCRCRNLKCF